MTPSNFHTHTCFCDGKDTPEELVTYAISLGCEAIGFTGHSYTPFDGSFCMSKENTEKYIKAVTELKEKYSEKIKIFLGVEQDIFSSEPTDRYDYIIGSVHYVYKDGKYLSVDDTAEEQKKIVNEHYNGDFYAFAEDYYKTLSGVYDKTKCHIIGHFDLITKFNENNRLFDTGHPRYRKAVSECLDVLLKTDCVFEINFGAVSKGYRTLPYPEKNILEIIKAAGKKTVYTSDCHDKEKLLFGLSAK